MVPNGVLLIDVKTKEITIANKEMEDIANFGSREKTLIQ